MAAIPVGRSVRFLPLLSSFAVKARALLRDRKANVAMMFGLSLVPIMVATGAGIDFARGVMVHQRMSEALDAAALAVGNATSKPSSCSSSGDSSSRSSCAPLQQLAQQYFDQNYDHTKDADYGTPGAVSIAIADQSVTLTSSLSLKLTLMGMTPLNVGSPTVNASTTVVWGQTKLWVALVLDNSGSMANGDASGTKMAALQDAITNSSYGLLHILQTAAVNAGDINVGIVPFTRSVNMGAANFSGSNYIDWGEWEAPPANAGTLSGNLGPGGNCPWTTNNQGYGCNTDGSNSASSTNQIPSSGLICPSIDWGTVNTDHRYRFYNGCYDSVFTRTQTVTTDVSTPRTKKQNCSQTGSGTITCVNSGGVTTGGSNTTSNTTVTSGYTGDSTTSSSSSSSVNNDGAKNCNHNNPQTCTWTRNVVTTTVVETITKTGATPYSHTWQPNDHSTWSGCVMDRQQQNKQTTVNGGTGYRTPATQNYDESNTQPDTSGGWNDTQFPAENPLSCPAASVTTLNYNWSSLSAQVSAMSPNGSTNQAIGVEHGWQMLTTGAPYGTGSLPSQTTKVIILFSDGLNTQDRWYGDGSTEGTTEDGYIDTRENAACTAAKSDGVVIYAIFIHIGTNGSSTALQNCATDANHYYDLTASSQIRTAFSDIAQKITNLRVSR